MQETVIVIAGTTEAHQVVKEQLEQNKRVIATVATELGREMLKKYSIEIKEGRLTKAEFVRFFQEEKAGRVIDASHPFAKEVTKEVKEACAICKIPYECYEREKTEYDYDQIIWVQNEQEAAELLNQMEGRILLTTGVNTIGFYMEKIENAKKRLFVRVLNHEKSIQACEKAGVLKEHLCAQMPPFTAENNRELLLKYKCKILVSKDSGEAGGVLEKVQAAKALSIPVIMIRRPVETITVKQPRLLIAGTGSGCGKTTITCALLKALCQKKYSIAAFKCGPDYIDPMLHSHITGQKARNLDPFFAGEEEQREILVHGTGECDLAVVEGVMGYYDGIGVQEEGSTWSVSMAASIPTILIISVKGMSATLTAILQGILSYRKNPIQGIILNQCTASFYSMIKPVLEKTLSVKLLGYFPKNAEIIFPERHLGLMTAQEISDLDTILEKLGKIALETLDLDEIVRLAQGAEALSLPQKSNIYHGQQEIKARDRMRPKIAVARDEAFCFYYEENLEVLRELGAELVFVSPMWDQALPEEISGIYFGGGYPEVYAKELSENISFLESVRRAFSRKVPMIAECGGFLYLCKAITDSDGRQWKMTGLISVETVMKNKLNPHFGYVTMKAQESCLIAEKDDRIRAHEFHYSEVEQDGACFLMEKSTGRSWTGVYGGEHFYAGYPHLFFRTNRRTAEKFIKKVKEQWQQQ